MFRLMLRAVRGIQNEFRRRQDPIAFARAIGVRIGQDCRLIHVTARTFGSEPFLVKLGDHVTVAAGVSFITHDGGVWVFRNELPMVDVVAPITVGNNVFIGTNAIVMPGVSIGSDCVIGAGAVVTRDIPCGHVAAGVPARCIKTIEQYRTAVQECAMETKLVPAHKKRAIYENRFLRDGAQR